MDGITIIQEELKKQKSIIESMDGKVKVSNINPTPAEITAGIQSIPSVDLSGSTATEQDVKQGKTFYSGNSILKTGAAVFETDTTNALFMFPKEQVSYDGEIYYAIPEGLSLVRRYCFYYNSNHVTIAFNDDLTSIDEYAFYKTPNFKFENFNGLPNLTYLGMHCFDNSGADGIDMGNVPNTVYNIGSYSFYYSVKENLDFRFPDALTSMGQYAFMAKTRTLANSLDVSNYKLNAMPAYTFYNVAFNCDFIQPAKLNSISMYFNHNGSFKNIVFHSSITLGNMAFGGTETNPVENFYLKTVTFQAETPGNIGTNVFAKQNIQNGLKIYVPDNAVEAYKAVTNLAPYADIIYPMSEKP